MARSRRQGRRAVGGFSRRRATAGRARAPAPRPRGVDAAETAASRAPHASRTGVGATATVRDVVLVDFSSYCCINCVYALPTLAQLDAHVTDLLEEGRREVALAAQP